MIIEIERENAERFDTFEYNTRGLITPQEIVKAVMPRMAPDSFFSLWREFYQGCWKLAKWKFVQVAPETMIELLNNRRSESNRLEMSGHHWW